MTAFSPLTSTITDPEALAEACAACTPSVTRSAWRSGLGKPKAAVTITHAVDCTWFAKAASSDLMESGWSRGGFPDIEHATTSEVVPSALSNRGGT